jgi:iron complex outermembrane receptor protein
MGSGFFRAMLVAGVCATAMSAQAATAQQPRVYNVPAGDLRAAIELYIRQSGEHVIYRVDQVRGRRTAGVRGALASEDALARILAGANLVVSRDSSGALAIGAPQGDAQPRGGAAAEVEEVVVTASKREESLRDVAQSVTAVTEKSLQRLSANNFADYAKVVPGLTLSSVVPGNTQLILRGINAGGVGSLVTTYIDETPYGSSSALANGAITTPDVDPADLERIEVLRGPQGTLYGSGAMGGLLKFVTRAPDPSGFAARVQGGVESVDGETGWSARGMINLPLGDRAAVRITANRREDAGFIDDPVRGAENINGSVSTGGRVSLLLKPNDDLTFRLSALGQDIDTDGSSAVDLVLDLTDPDGAGPLGRGAPVQPFKPFYGDLQQSRAVAEYSDVAYRLYNGTAEWNLGFANLTWSTSYGTFRQHGLNDYTLIGQMMEATLDQKKFTQEVRLASPVGEHFEWLLGGYYTRETAALYQEFSIPFGGPSLGAAQLDSIYKEAAVFGSLTWKITPTFDIAAGGRFAHNEQWAHQYGLGANAGGTSEEDVWTYSVAPRWRPNELTTVYARIAKGYRPGGPNNLPPNAPIAVPTTFESDSLISYEAGVKADLFDRRLSVDVAAYFIDWSNIQLLTRVNNYGVNGNGGAAESKGFEWSFIGRPVRGLTLVYSGAYTDATLTTDTGGGITDPSDFLLGRSGERLPYVPEWSGALSADYDWTIGDDAQAFVGATWAYVGERLTNISGRGIGRVELPAYDTVDLRAGVEFRKWTIQAYVKNLGDERGLTGVGGNATAQGGAPYPYAGVQGRTAVVIRPRTLGFTVTARF